MEHNIGLRVQIVESYPPVHNGKLGTIVSYVDFGGGMKSPVIRLDDGETELAGYECWWKEAPVEAVQ